MTTSEGRWRVGRHYGIHVYEGDRPVATFHDPKDARRAVDAVNRIPEHDLSWGSCRRCGTTKPDLDQCEPRAASHQSIAEAIRAYADRQHHGGVNQMTAIERSILHRVAFLIDRGELA